MHKLFFFIAIFLLVLGSCNKKISIIGKWQMVGNGAVVKFITDSSGSIIRSDSIQLLKEESFRYKLKNDTLFEEASVHLYDQRKWKILKLTKDSLLIYCDGINAHYYRLN